MNEQLVWLVGGMLVGGMLILLVRWLWPYVPALPKKLRVHLKFKRVMKPCGRCGGTGEIRYQAAPNSGMPELINPCWECKGSKEIISHIEYRYPWLEPHDPGKAGKEQAEAEEVLAPDGQ